MKKLTKITLLINIYILIGLGSINAQIDKESAEINKPEIGIQSISIPVHISFQAKTSHLWRGLDSSPSPLFCTDISVSDKNEIFKVGLWNGLGTDGTFKEFNHYLSISKSGFTFELWDIYNFSSDAKHNNTQYFNYEAHETGRFLDAFVKYRVPGKLPFQLMWSTILFGRDRGVLNECNRYSSYVEIEYPIYRSNFVNFDLGVGGAFALRKGKDENGRKTDTHFYGNSAGVTNISLKASKDITVCNYTIPVSIYWMWNPEGNHANVQVAATLFSM